MHICDVEPTGILDLPHAVLLQIAADLSLKDTISMTGTCYQFAYMLESLRLEHAMSADGYLLDYIFHWALRHNKSSMKDYDCDPPTFNRVRGSHYSAELNRRAIIIARLLDKGIRLNVSNPTSSWIGGMTPLHWAASSGSFEMTALVVDAGADLEAKDNQQRTALHLAAAQSRYDLRFIHGQPTTPALKACPNDTHSKHPTVELLLRAGARPNVFDEKGFTPLHYTTFPRAPGNLSMACLLQYRANPRLRADDYQTPLHLAATDGNLEGIEMLLNWGANVDALDSTGGSPLSNAITKKGDMHAAGLLIHYGANVNLRKGLFRRTVLHDLANLVDPRSFMARHKECLASFLIKSGADVQAKDVRGRTAAFYASQMGKSSNGLSRILEPPPATGIEMSDDDDGDDEMETGSTAPRGGPLSTLFEI